MTRSIARQNGRSESPSFRDHRSVRSHYCRHCGGEDPGCSPGSDDDGRRLGVAGVQRSRPTARRTAKTAPRGVMTSSGEPGRAATTGCSGSATTASPVSSRGRVPFLGRALRQHRVWIASFVAILGVAEIAFAVQIRTWHGRGSWIGDPTNKVFVASWMASEMWVNVWLLVVGATTVTSAVVTCFTCPRPADRRTEARTF